MDRKTQNEDTQLWYDAANLQTDSKFDEALVKYSEVTNKLAKIHFNIGLIKLSKGKPSDAISSFTQTIEKDGYMAFGFFARGVANYEAKRYPQALEDFEKTLKLYRGSPMIDYSQLGMKYKLFQCEVLVDAGLTCIKIGNSRERDFFAQAASPETHIEERHAVYANGKLELMPLVGIGETLPFYPPANHVAALKKKNWVKKSEVKAAWNGDTDTSWNGEELLERKRKEEKKKEKKEKPPQRPTMTAEALRHLANEQGLSAANKDPTHIVKFDYDKAYDGDLELQTGDLVSLTLDNNDGWYTGYSQRLKQYGVFPATYVTVIPKSDAAVSAKPPPPSAAKVPKKPSPPADFQKDLKKKVASAASKQAEAPPKQKPVPPPPPKSVESSPPSGKKPPPGRRAPSLAPSTTANEEPSKTSVDAPRKFSSPAVSVSPPTGSTSASAQMAEIVRKANERKATQATKGITRSAGAQSMKVVGSEGTSGVDRERSLTVKERLAQSKGGTSGPSKTKVAVAFGQSKSAWQYASDDARTPALSKVVDQAVKSHPSVQSAESFVVKVRHKETRRLRVQSDITVAALEARIMEKLGLKESIVLWWSDQGNVTRLSGPKLGFNFKSKGGEVYCMQPGKTPVV